MVTRVLSRTVSSLAALAPAVVLLVSCAAAQTPAPLGPAWAPVAAPAEGSPERQCANWTDWTAQVRLRADGRVEAVKSGGPGAPPPPAAPMPPFPVVSDIKVGGPVLWRPIDGGYLVGFNHGEFGGAIWWYDAKGTSRRRLGDAHPVGFADLVLPGRTVLAGIVEGLAHLDQDAGSVSVVERRSDGTIALAKLLDLPSAPQAVGVSGPSGTLVATGSAVVRIERNGTVRRIASIDMQALYPQSIVETASGSIFLGMRRYVVEVAPAPLSTRVSWYTDAACQGFRPVTPASCVCR